MSELKVQESKIFSISIAIISTSENEYDSLTDKNHVLYLNDRILEYESFLDTFYKNNNNYFEINDQYKGEEYLSINTTTKHKKFNFLNKKSMMDIVDTMNENYISKNKKKMPQSSYMRLIKDVNNCYTLFDYKYYKFTLSLDDINSIYYKHDDHKTTHIRFTITANFYSEDLKDGVDINVNYLVEIPSYMRITSEEPVILVNNEFLNEENTVENTLENNVENMTYSNYNDEKDFLSSFNF